MAITVNTKAYAFDTNPTPDSAMYQGPAHTFSAADTLLLKRVAPKPTSTFPGVARASLKFTRNVTINDVVYVAVAEASFSLPVGMAEADVDAIRDDLGDLLLLTAADDLVWKHDLNA